MSKVPRNEDESVDISNPHKDPKNRSEFEKSHKASQGSRDPRTANPSRVPRERTDGHNEKEKPF